VFERAKTFGALDGAATVTKEEDKKGFKVVHMIMTRQNQPCRMV
jgi:hypothetical protein